MADVSGPIFHLQLQVMGAVSQGPQNRCACKHVGGRKDLVQVGESNLRERIIQQDLFGLLQTIEDTVFEVIGEQVNVPALGS